MSESPVGKLLGHKEDKRTFEATDKLVLSRCNIGIEIECERVRNPGTYTMPFWMGEADNSLRNDGREFKLIEPLFGQDLISAIDNFCEVAVTHNFDHSPRAGTHIHLDMRSLTLGELNKFCTLYAIAEPIFFSVGDPARWESNFCVPWAREGETLHLLGMIKHTHNEGSKAAQVKAFKKYSALNLGALNAYGSVEFRHFPSTRDRDKLIYWVNLTMCLKRAVKQYYTDLGAQDIVNEFSALGPVGWVEKIFPRKDLSDFIRLHLSGESLYHKLWTAMRTAQLCANMDLLLFQNLPRSGFIEKFDEKDFYSIAIKEVSKRRKPKGSPLDKVAQVEQELVAPQLATTAPPNIRWVPGHPNPFDTYIADDPLQPLFRQ